MSDCPVCYEPSNEWIDSVNSSCSHTLCITCFLNLSRTSEPLCPMCRADYRESILTFGDTSASAPRRLATRDAAFITAVTEAAAVAVEQRPVVIKAKLDEFKMATDLYERQWLLIRSSEEMVRQYIVYVSRSQHLIKYFDDALTELRRITENDGYQKPGLFLVSSVTAILETTCCIPLCAIVFYCILLYSIV